MPIEGHCIRAYLRNRKVYADYRRNVKFNDPTTSYIYTARPKIQSPLWSAIVEHSKYTRYCLVTEELRSDPMRDVVHISTWGDHQEKFSYSFHENNEEALWFQFCRNVLTRWGMPPMGHARYVPKDIVNNFEKLQGYAFRFPQVTWGGLLRDMCDKWNNMEFILRLLRSTDEIPVVERVTPVSSRHGAARVKLKLCGAATLSQLLDPSFDFEKYEAGLTSEQFLYRNPAVVHETQQCWALMRWKLCEK